MEEKSETKCYCGTDLYIKSSQAEFVKFGIFLFGKHYGVLKQKEPIRFDVYCKNKNCPNSYWTIETKKKAKQMLKNKTVKLRE